MIDMSNEENRMIIRKEAELECYIKEIREVELQLLSMDEEIK